eukprot:210727_1
MSLLLNQLAMLWVTSYSYSLSGVTLQSSNVPYDFRIVKMWTGRHYQLSGRGYIDKQVQTYNIRTDTWNARPWISQPLETHGSFTSIDNMVYFTALDSNIAVFSSFNIDTQELLHPHPTISLLYPALAPCITTDNRYIYIIGGFVLSTSSYVAYFQIYDTLNDHWFEGLPLNIPRTKVDCEYHDGYIYIFGGQIALGPAVFTDSIEMVYVGVGDAVETTVSTQEWITLPAVLSSPKRDVSTVMCTDVDTDIIYIFGGDDLKAGAADMIQIF